MIKVSIKSIYIHVVILDQHIDALEKTDAIRNDNNGKKVDTKITKHNIMINRIHYVTVYFHNILMNRTLTKEVKSVLLIGSALSYSKLHLNRGNNLLFSSISFPYTYMYT